MTHSPKTCPTPGLTCPLLRWWPLQMQRTCEDRCGILRNAKLPKDNLMMEQRKALKELRELEDEVW